MWENGFQIEKPVIDLNTELEKIQGDILDDLTAQTTLAQFLYHNLGFTTHLLTGIELFPFQELILRGWFKRNFNMGVWGRGASKSWTVAMFCLLYAIFHRNSRIVLVAQNFRTSRRIFEQIYQFIVGRNAVLAQQCFPKEPVRRNEAWEWDINGGKITCLPLAQGDKIRGTRADVLVVDEFALIPQDIYEKVLLPFLSAKTNIAERRKISKMEAELIRDGKMDETDRLLIDSGKRIILLSSASFQFEYLYKLYKKWTDAILKEPKEGDKPKKTTFFVSQLSWDVLPEELVEEEIALEAKNGGVSNAVFLREFCGQFTDDSDSYFNMKKMNDCTVPNGSAPVIEMFGEPGAKYILAIDPSFSSSKSSDDFAMNIIKLHPETKKGTLVHNYAEAGKDLKEHIVYFHYLLTHFNVEFIIGDSAGTEVFVKACNESSLFKDSKTELAIMKKADFDQDDYTKALREAKMDYNLSMKKIVYIQPFNPKTIRKMNEVLQAAIDHKRIWFASKPTFSPEVRQKMLERTLPIFSSDAEEKRRSSMSDAIDAQEDLMELTKKECNLIEVSTSTSTGIQQFDLPSHLRNSSQADKARKDSYTVLMLGNWAMKCFFDMSAFQGGYGATFKPMSY